VADELERIRRVLLQERVGENDVKALMADTRVVLENEKLHEEYRVLSFYCDWMLHGHLSRSAMCFRIMETLADIVAARIEDPNQFVEKISESVLTEGLRGELIDFVKRFGPDGHRLKDASYWVCFFRRLVGTLLDRPVRLPPPGKQRSPKDQERRRRLNERAHWNLGIPTALWLERRQVDVNAGNWQVWWNIQFMKPGAACPISLAGPLLLKLRA
jgi:hypothetical protein